MLVVGITLCLVTTFLTGCMATAAVTVVSQTVKTTAKAAGTAARLTMDGARVASHTITKPFRKDEDENYR
jgi:K+-transporting ATPase c subunit